MLKAITFDFWGAKNAGMGAMLFTGISRKQNADGLADAVFEHWSDFPTGLNEVGNDV